MSTQQLGDRVPEWTVGDRLRKAREIARLDQQPFADAIGVSRGTVSNYERGSVDHYKPIVLRAWAMATGVPLEWLETGVTTSTPPPRGGPSGDELHRLTEAKRGRARSSRRHAETTDRYLPAAVRAA